MSDALESVARAIALGHFARRFKSANGEFIGRRVDSHWPEFVPDARLVMATIDRLVQQETFDDAVADLPVVPAFLQPLGAQ